MAKIAKVEVQFSESGIDKVEERLKELENKGKSLFARLPKEVQKEFIKAGEAIQDSVKGAVLGAVNDLGQAIAGPAKSTFSGVLAAANQYRKEVSGIAVATGKEFSAVSGKVDQVSTRIGELPSRTMGWARAVKGLTGDWDNAVDSIAEFKNVALALDRPLEDTAAMAGRLGASFGIKSQDQVRQFFGLMNAQAKETGVTFNRVHNQFGAFADSFARMSSKGASTFAGISAAFAGSSSDPEQAQRNQGFGMGVLNQGVRLVEMRMRNKGLLGKGEYISDSETGEIDPKKYLKAMQFMQKDMLRFYGGSKKRAIEVQAGEDLEMRRTVGGFLNTDLSKVSDLSQLKPEQIKALEKYSGMAAGKRDVAEATKNIKDIGAGTVLLPEQDAAVAVGGGEAGLAMEAAAGVFKTTVDKFGGIIGSLVGFLAKKGLPFLPKALAAGAGVVGGAATMLVPSDLEKEPSIPGREAIPGTWEYRAPAFRDAARRLKDAAAGGAVEPAPSDVTSKLTPLDLKGFEEKFGAVLTNKILKVQLVPTATAPYGEASGE